MKTIALSCLLAALVLLPAVALADWSDNFDSYVQGSGLHGQGGWHGWDGSAGADAYVSGVQSLSAPNSVEITGPSDMVHEYTGSTSGTCVYTAWQFVPTDFAGTTYFILLNTYADLGTDNWSTQVNFASATGLVTNDGVDGGTLPLIRERWVEIRVVIDLDANLQTFYYDNQLLYSSSWTENLSPGGGAVNIAAVDLFANGASPVYYDDMSLVCGGTTPTENTTWGGVKSLFR
jgi:hypothetical protein